MNRISTRSRSRIVRLFLAALLVFAQQQAVLHAFEHDDERIAAQSGVQKESSGHPAELCAKCLAIAHLDHAGDAPTFHMALPEYAPPRFALVLPAGIPAAFVAVYRSRAPPFFS